MIFLLNIFVQWIPQVYDNGVLADLVHLDPRYLENPLSMYLLVRVLSELG